MKKNFLKEYKKLIHCLQISIQILSVRIVADFTKLIGKLQT
jgi:hypothetical protein